jgi:predicted XRE-type DNA-binding protein
MAKKVLNNYNYQYPQGDKEIIDKISNPNYEVGTYILPKKASVEEKIKYEICQTILKYQQENQISYQEISQQIDFSFAKTMNVLKGRINDFNLNELVNCLEKLTIPCQVKIIPTRLKPELTHK